MCGESMRQLDKRRGSRRSDTTNTWMIGINTDMITNNKVDITYMCLLGNKMNRNGEMSGNIVTAQFTKLIGPREDKG
jgi:hypothetical protein